MYKRLAGGQSGSWRRWTIQVPVWLMIAGCVLMGFTFNSTFVCSPAEWEASAAKFKIGTCVIEKSMSTILAAVTCLLHDPEAFLKANRSVSTDMYENRFCKDKNEYKSMRQMMQANSIDEANPAGWLFLAAVRDPIDRFLSGYVDKCIKEEKRKKTPGRCYGCGPKNLTCLWIGSTRGRCDTRPFFAKFKFLRVVPPHSPAYPQMLNELVDLKCHAGITHQLVHQLREAQTTHSTSRSAELREAARTLRKDRALMERLVQLFYYDFALFGFDFPDD
ncbi:hypothetical protein M3Y99_00546900 [Aphelenchoides fujianensis]|nr:hypothetical protein M3Y99_00546900 [Aphelenchoides fujianensis]